jgi:hypothetical protein
MNRPFKLVRVALIGEYFTQKEAYAAMALQPRPNARVKLVVVKHEGNEDAEVRRGARKKAGAAVAERTPKRRGR